MDFRNDRSQFNIWNFSVKQFHLINKSKQKYDNIIANISRKIFTISKKIHKQYPISFKICLIFDIFLYQFN